LTLRRGRRTPNTLKQQLVGLSSSLQADWLFVSLISGFVSYLLFKVADRNARTAEDQAFITALTVGQTQHMIGQAIEQTRAAQQGAEAAKSAATTAYRELGVIREEQRPWLFANQGAQMTITVGAPMSFNMKILNSGKSAALHVRTDDYMEIIPNDGTLPRFESNDPRGRMSIEIITPNGTADIVAMRDQKRLVMQAEKESLDAGNSWVAVYGIIHYADVFKTPYWTKYCAWFNFNAKREGYYSKPCVAYNDVGEGTSPNRAHP
jgi:hypothetical protein